MNKELSKTWQRLKRGEKKEIFSQTAAQWNLPAAAIEKDWWVVRTLELVFTTEIAPHTVFKGGTSLSKAWNLIDRFSEDIDLALDRKFLGFGGAMSGAQVAKLRKQSCKYISDKYFPNLQKTFQDGGLEDVVLKLVEVKSTDEDPIKIAVLYPSLTEQSAYLAPQVLIEIGSRSLKEPYSDKLVCSFVGENFEGEDFADKPITIPTVNPERTFLEKIFLLHEEFQRPTIKIERKSRHLYDLEKLMDTVFAKKALSNKSLYQQIVEHRKSITPVRGIDYTLHAPEKINPVPPTKLLDDWRKDYSLMQESMVYTDSLSFEKLIERITELKNRINQINN